MLGHLRNNVVAYLALVVAMTGATYAAVQLQKGQVKTKHLANSAVTTQKVKNRTLKAKDLKAGVLPKGTSRVVARARFTGDQAGTLNATAVPLTGAAWTQAANEVDQFFGTVKVDFPSTAQCGPGEIAGIVVQVGGVARLNLVLDSDDFPSAGTNVYDLTPTGRPVGFEPGAATPRTVVATFLDSCTGSIRFHLRQLKIDVVGVN